MPPRRRPLASLGLALVLLAAAGCATAPAPRVGQVQHLVICWLKNPGSAADRDRLIQATYALADLPGLLHVAAGPPLPGLDQRPVVDTSYDVAILMTFKNTAALTAYQQHPRHRQAVEDILQPLVRRFVVYDFVPSP
jgi:hypothetical protein